MRFKTGQEIVCIHKGEWFSYSTRILHARGPKENEIVTCDGYSPLFPDFIYLKEYKVAIDGGNACWKEIDFQPLVEDSVLEKELQSIELSKRQMVIK